MLKFLDLISLVLVLYLIEAHFDLRRIIMALFLIACEFIDPDHDSRNLSCLLRSWDAREVTESTWMIRSAHSYEQVALAMLQGPISPKDRLTVVEVQGGTHHNPREDCSDL